MGKRYVLAPTSYDPTPHGASRFGPPVDEANVCRGLGFRALGVDVSQLWRSGETNWGYKGQGRRRKRQETGIPWYYSFSPGIPPN